MSEQGFSEGQENSRIVNPEDMKAQEEATEEGMHEAPGNGAPKGDAAATAALDEWKNKVAYLAAEIENMRKRFVREKSEVVKFANEELLRAILPVVDNLHYAVKAVKDAEAKLEPQLKDHPILSGLVKGVDMTLVHFEQTLDRLGVKSVAAQGDAFNPEMHEAVGQSSDASLGENTVAAVMQKGYVLHGRVLRPARVFVNKNA